MARPARQEQTGSARSSHQLIRFYRSIHPDMVFGTHTRRADIARPNHQVRKVPRADLTTGNASRRSRSLVQRRRHELGSRVSDDGRPRVDHKAPIEPKDVDAVVDYLISIRDAN